MCIMPCAICVGVRQPMSLAPTSIKMQCRCMFWVCMRLIACVTVFCPRMALRFFGDEEIWMGWSVNGKFWRFSKRS